MPSLLHSTPRRGRWSVANQLSLSLHFRHLKDKQVLGYLIQYRTGHTFHGKYYHRFILTESTSYPCEESLQIQEHLMRVWPTCERHSKVLHDISPNIYLPDILGARTNMVALAGFLEKSRAFMKNGCNPPSCHEITIKDRSLGDLTETGYPEE